MQRDFYTPDTKVVHNYEAHGKCCFPWAIVMFRRCWYESLDCIPWPNSGSTKREGKGCPVAWTRRAERYSRTWQTCSRPGEPQRPAPLFRTGLRPAISVQVCSGDDADLSAHVAISPILFVTVRYTGICEKVLRICWCF